MSPKSKKLLSFVLPTGAIIASLLLLSTCQDDGSGTKNPSSADATGISGTWTSGCLAEAGKSGTFFLDNRAFESVTTFRTTFSTFSDKACTTRIMTQVQAGSYAISNPEEGQTARPIDLTIGTVFITLHTEALIASYNARSFCGGGWELDVERAITRDMCVTGTSTSNELDMMYELFEIVDGKIFFGLKDADHNGRSEEKRPVVVDSSRGYAKT
jgi:hypothetical protein